MARLLAAHAEPPRIALCSDARRALDTLAAVRSQVALLAEIRSELHHAEPAVLWEHVARLDDAYGAALVVGHNPGLHRFACELVGSGRRSLRRRLAERFPTAALAEVELDAAAWRDAAPGTGRLVELVFPRDLD